MSKYSSVFLGTLLAAVGTSAAAHHLFIVPDRFQTAPGEVLAIGVHNADSFPESASVAQRFQRLDLHAGEEVIGVSVSEDGKRLVGEVTIGMSGHVFARASTAESVIELEPEEFVDYLREEGLTHVIEWRARNGEADRPGRERYAKYAKSILLSGEQDETYSRALGLPIEIVAEKSPYSAAVGGVLPVRVLFRGAPAADLEVTAAWTSASGVEQQVVGRTNAQGRVSVPVVAPGPWRLHTILMERRSEPEVDWESYWATLTFEVP